MGDINNKTIIKLYDDAKRIHNYELLDIVIYDGKEYAVMMPENSWEKEVEIFQLEHSEDKSATFYTPAPNDYINMQVYKIFKENYTTNYPGSIKFEDND